jgi:PAS domain S-box-containing protein
MILVRESRIVFVNPPCVKLLKAESQDQLVGKLLSDLFHPDHREWIAEAGLTDEATRAVSSLETFSLCLDNSTREVEVSASSFLHDGVVNVQVIVHDISVRKQLETQCRQAQKMEVTGLLAGGIAHDFNNLMAVILGCCQFLESDATLNDDNRELIEEIFKAGNRAANLTRQLLAYSRQQVLQPAVLNLNEVVLETGVMLERVIGEDVALTSNMLPSLWSVKVDAGQMQQVIMNLSVNARDAMPQGGKLTIETANVELDESYTQTYPDVKPGRYVVLSVSDTGCGMDAKTKARMFEPFFTTKGVGKGTGLGLATIFGIVKQSGGHVTVYSEPGHGSTFKVYLPRVESQVGETEKPPQSAPARGTETVLVVEDEDGVRNLAGRILRSQGYTVLEARNGSEALLTFQDHQQEIELVLTDVVMPEMGGRHLHERLLTTRPDLAVLFMSGYTDDAVVRHGVLESEKNFIQKPFTCAALASAVRRVLDERNCEATAGSAPSLA